MGKIEAYQCELCDMIKAESSMIGLISKGDHFADFFQACSMADKHICCKCCTTVAKIAALEWDRCPPENTNPQK